MNPKITIDNQLCWLRKDTENTEYQASVVFDVGYSGAITTEITLDDKNSLHIELDSGVVVMLAAAIREKRRK